MKADLTSDVIATLNDQLVLVERHKEPEGLALPGGHHEYGETLKGTAIREMKEETGLDFKPENMVGIYDEPGRDPRGQKVSVVYAGEAYGDPVSEEAATDVVIVPYSDAENISDQLVFDHGKILQEFLEGQEQDAAQAAALLESPEFCLLTDYKGSEEYEGFEADRYASIESYDSLDEAEKAHYRDFSGELIATDPVSRENNAVKDDSYVLIGKLNESYTVSYMGRDRERKTRTRYPIIECGQDEVDQAVEALENQGAEWVRPGAKIDNKPA